jgi:hypothetical protein
VDLDSVADELYGLPRQDFTPTRDARAADARRAGDRELAAAVKGLRRPTTSAWLTNMLVRHRPDQVVDLLDVGQALRDAQARLAADELRRLSQERNRAVTALGREARRLAGQLGQAVSDDVERELVRTLEAGLADPAAGEAVRSGRLTAALSYSGLGPVDLTDAVAPGSGTGPRRAGPGRATADAGTGDAAARELEDARAAAAEAGRAADEGRRQLVAARADHERRRRRLRDLEAQLERARAEEVEAAARLDEVQRACQAAERAEREAPDRVAGADPVTGAEAARRRAGAAGKGSSGHPFGPY